MTVTSDSQKDVEQPQSAEEGKPGANPAVGNAANATEAEDSTLPLSVDEVDDEAVTPKPAAVAAVATPEEELVRVREQLLRMAADFDNYRKRSRRDVAEAERRVQEQLIRALLPSFDNIERAANHAESASDLASLLEGLGMVQRQFQDTLKGLGIDRVKSMGEPFDPAEHEAVQHIETAEVAPGAVAQELQPGYRWNGRLVRPAMVVVAKAPTATVEAEGSAANDKGDDAGEGSKPDAKS